MVKVGDEARNKDEIDRSFTHHLIGDAKIAAPGVMGLNHHGSAPGSASMLH
jgi:hypothetical protein